jgi:hypothetical protein
MKASEAKRLRDLEVEAFDSHYSPSIPAAVIVDLVVVAMSVNGREASSRSTRPHSNPLSRLIEAIPFQASR